MASFQDRAQHAIAQLDKEVSRVCVFWFCVLFLLPVSPPIGLRKGFPFYLHCICSFIPVLQCLFITDWNRRRAGGWDEVVLLFSDFCLLAYFSAASFEAKLTISSSHFSSPSTLSSTTWSARPPSPRST